MTSATHSDKDKKASNRRRYARIPVLQQARLSVVGASDLPCEILDYCRGGLYVRMTSAKSMHLVHGGKGETVEVRIESGNSMAFPVVTVTGTIVRVTEGGVGIAFEEAAARDALTVLDQIAQGSHGGPICAVNPELEKLCQQALNDCVLLAFNTFHSRVEADLFKAADRAKNSGEQSGYFDAATLLRNAKYLASAYIDRVLLQSREYRVITDPETTATTDRLSLIETDVFEDWLNLLGEIARLEASHEQSLRTLEVRIGRFSGVAINPKNNPYGPAAMLTAFREALREHNLTVPAKKVVYATFAGALREILPPHYHRLESLTLALDDARPLAPIAAPARPVRAAPVAQAAAQAIPAVPEETAEVSPAPTEPLPAQPLPGSPSTISAAFSALQQLAIAPAGQHPANLQAAVSASQIAMAQPSNMLPPAQSQAINMLGAVISDIQVNEHVHPEVKPFFEQWQQPLINLAMKDPDLLNIPSHPARRLLDALDQVSLSVSESSGMDQRVRQYLQQWTEHLRNTEDITPEVMAQLAQAVEQLTQPLVRAKNRRMERLRETCEGQQRVADAHRAVQDEINRRLAGKSVPKVVVQLLEMGWHQWLLLTRLRTHDDDPEWKGSLAVLDLLLSWIGHPERKLQQGEAHRIIKFIDDRLLPISQDRAAALTLMDEINRLLLQSARPEWVSVTPADPVLAEPPDAQQLQRLRQFTVGDWIDYSAKPGEPAKALRLTWIAPNKDRFVFADRRGVKQLDISAVAFASLLDDERIEYGENLDRSLSERTVNDLMQQMQVKLRDQATQDPVTGLLSRKAFTRRLEDEVIAASSDKGHVLAIMELEQWRTIVSVCGVNAGENLLQELAVIVGSKLKGNEYASHIGDNQFAWLFHNTDPNQAHRRAEDLLIEVNKHRIHWQDRSFTPGGHIGMAGFIPGLIPPADVFKNADAACSRAAETGPSVIHFFREDDKSLSAQHQAMSWAGRIDRVLGENRLFARCQRIMPIAEGAPSHYEILLGVVDDKGEVIPPASFIAAAERFKRMTDVDGWQVQNVFDWIEGHRAQFETIGGFAINLSGQSLNSGEFLQSLHSRLDAARFPLHKIIFEITETAAIAEFGQAETFMRQIRRYGCRFSLDDFGAGFSSYAYLKNLRADYLKIDGSFVRELATNASDCAMVKSMTEIGHSLDMKVVAEYVESEAILDKLKEIGVDYAQGYFVGKPHRLSDLD